MSFLDNSYPQLWRSSCLRNRLILGNLRRSPYEFDCVQKHAAQILQSLWSCIAPDSLLDVSIISFHYVYVKTKVE